VTTLFGIGLLLTGQIPFATVGGPIMMFDLAGRSVETGIGHFLFIMAVISINLAILNLLPVPVLDGGHLLFLVIEAVRRHPVSLRARERATFVGLLALLLLMILVMRNDLARYWDQWFN
jgi:regulator of sigma E protease